jgi:phosphoribosylaminoimidazole-succinocarboxamide synthase
MEKRQQLYQGKAKTVYATDDPHRLVMHYRDDVSAFDGAKLAQLDGKGETNNRINAYVMDRLAAAGVPTHFVALLNARESLVKAMRMIPVECVVRNICAGSMAKRYGIAEGTRLAEPVFEFFLKSDALHDPLCNDDHIRVLGWASPREIVEMKAITHAVNGVLKPLFADAGIDLVDYKLEFGHPIDDPQGPLVLGDEFTPDGCRLWDANSGEKLDKDRFRRVLGGVIEHYREVARRIGVALSRRVAGFGAPGVAGGRRQRPSRVAVSPGSPVAQISS